LVSGRFTGRTRIRTGYPDRFFASAVLAWVLNAIFVLCFNFRPVLSIVILPIVPPCCLTASIVSSPVSLPFPLVARINKKNSQKDAEQKKNGNYFFYDDGADDSDDEGFDDI
jgi:hypothetical protein